MTKRQVRKESYRQIVKEGKSHQETFDQLKDTKAYDTKVLAELLSAIPSGGKQKELATLRNVYMGLLGVIMLLRLISYIPLHMDGTLETPGLIIIVLWGMIVPVIGIYACIYAKTELYRSVGILLGLSLLISFSPGTFNTDTMTLVVLGILALTVFLAFYIPIKLRTPYTATVSSENVNGTNQNITHYHFEDTRAKREDVLDDGL